MEDLTGRRFGRWTVVSLHSSTPHPKGTIRRWNCECECGTKKDVLERSLIKGVSSSCGCLHKEIVSKSSLKHGMTFSRIYNIWHDMMQRCYNPNCKGYENYGGRKIQVVDEWKDSSTFIAWAYSNGYQDDLSIDRIDVNGNYEPNNCRWADAFTQANNTRSNHFITIGVERHTLAEWARIKGVSVSAIYLRAKNGMTYEEAISKPFRKGNYGKRVCVE